MRLSKSSGIIAIVAVVCALLTVFPVVPGSTVAETGLIAQYKFDGDLNDASGKDHNGVLPDNYAHIGTKAFCPAVVFGCPACPHTVIY